MRNAMQVTWAHDWTSMVQPQFAKGTTASSPFRINAYAEMTATKMSPDAELGKTAINSSNRQRSVIAQD